jgi:hypothetical protein
VVLRYQVEEPAKYQVEGVSADRWGECRIVDISPEGAAVELLGALATTAVKSRVVLEVSVTDGSAELLPGQIKNVKRQRGGRVRIGLQFVEMSDSRRAAVASLLEP